MELEALLGVPPGSRAVAFHLVERGSFELRPEDGEPLVMAAGEMVLAVGGQAHHLAKGASARVTGFDELVGGAVERLYGPAAPGEDGSPRIICGALIFGDVQFNPLFESLPEYLRIRQHDSISGRRIDQLVSLLLEEITRGTDASDYVVERLLEILCAEGIRAYGTESAGGIGWFRGVADVAVGRALREFHSSPGEPWNIERLAATAHLSPSRFADRFVETTGLTAMTYVRRWRMNVAARALSETNRTVSELAFGLGYESPAAFSRAFKKHLGVSPADYRRRARSAADAARRTLP